MNVQKRPITMLELLISMTLMALILSTLTYFYFQMTVADRVLDIKQAENFQKRYAENRLSTVIPRVIAPGSKNKYFHFFTTPSGPQELKTNSQSLIFVFDNCVQSNKEMAYHVIGRLSLDEKGRFLLVTWPSEKRWEENESIPYSYEVLLENVKQLKFSFFVPPRKGSTDLKTGKPRQEMKQDPLEGMRGKWENYWAADWHELPAMLKVYLTIEKKGKEEVLTFAYPLPHVAQPITYDR